ncbi:ammonium transporter [uncultured Roseibium sp.]|uniref:ammonium transporter n=1 Tax=uncultured Roseibium sp. TaxID=1936171 RepID=UPI0025912EDB|nr:ammonium transporter [uncultured Roseibium sp.]
MNKASLSRPVKGLLILALVQTASGTARAQDGEATALAIQESLQQSLDLIWVMVAAALVLLMQVGFMLLEAGLVRSKNSINVAQKNLLDLTFSVLIFAAIGFMFAFASGNGFIVGWDTKLLLLQDLEPWTYAFFAFQVMFCGTAATIVSGAVAERMRLVAYVWCSVFTAGIIYPVFAHWAWGNALVPNETAFLAESGFVDFAGSTVVHSTGGWIGLAACIVLGPRLGRYDHEGRSMRIQGHSSVLATAGAFLLFVGWIGFNGGSTLSASSDVALIITNTVLAAAAGAAGGYFLGWHQDRLILPEKSLSGLLGGLVAVTAGCHILSPLGAATVGLLGGLVAVYANIVLDSRFKIDDPVGAIGVHGFAGIAGTIGLVFLAPEASLPLGDRGSQLLVQLEGVVLNFIWCFGLGFLFLKALCRFIPLRVLPADEEIGMNEAEHGTRLGIGHVEDALDKVIAGKADLNMRLKVSPGDDSERLTRMFNALMDTIQSEEVAQIRVADAKRTREESERLSALANATFDAIVISVDGRILDGNAALEELLGYEIEELKMRGLYEFVQSELAGTLESHLVKAELSPRELEMVNRSGETIPVEIRTRVISYRGTPTRVSALVDLRQRKEAEAQILHLAQHDPLTDLPNRAVFNAELNRAIGKFQDKGKAAALLLIDLDRFKDINDLHGHPIGDQVIRVTAERLREHSRKQDTISRLGGDEFALIQSDIQFANQAADMAHRLVQKLSEPIECGNGITLRPSASIGIALVGGRDDTTDSIVSNADIALYNAKNMGRNTYCLFQAGMGDLVRQRRELEEDLHAAIEEGQFELFYQPRLDLNTGSIESYEALIRWNHPEKGLVSPVDFIPAAEGSGQIIPIGKWVIQTALATAADELPTARLSVNVSPVQFRDNDFVEDVRRAIEASGIPASRLELEITENLLIEDDARALSILTSLKAIGVKIALDDFGVGYSSLGYLSRFPFDTIKIDRSFVSDAGKNSNSLAIIETVVRLGKALNMRVVAEGIEDLETLNLLIRSGCNEIQGFLIGRPQPVRALGVDIPTSVEAALKAKGSPPMREDTLPRMMNH